MKCLVPAVAGLVLLAAAGWARAALEGIIIADSVAEFSDVQGLGNWWYGFYDGIPQHGGTAYTPTDFDQSANLVVNSDGHWWMPKAGAGGYWTRTGKVWMHPNGLVTTGGRVAAEHWAVRRWLSEIGGSITITGNLSDADGGYGDGIIGYIFVDKTNIFMQRIYDNDSAGVDYSVTATVEVGSIVDFAIGPGPGSNDYRDMTNFTAVITPEPATILLLGLGGLALRRRRRG